MFSCEFCEISKNTFLYRTSVVSAAVYIQFRVSEKAWSNIFTNSETYFEF